MLDFVGASSKEVYWLPVASINTSTTGIASINTSTTGKQVLKYQYYVTDTSPTGKQGLSNQ
jgi:hypothetical protein